MYKKTIGIAIVILGILLVAGAVGLTAWNVKTDVTAGQTNEQLNEDVIQAILENKIQIESDDEGTVDFLPGIYTPDFTPGGVNDEEPELDTVVAQGQEYVGILSIPILGLELSVMNKCDDKSVDKAPGRWVGTPYGKGGFVIGGHNYRSHLGKIDRLREGDLITFTDLRGNVFNYSVVGQEILASTQGRELRDKEWGLSLFTCTLVGDRRIVVRSLLKDSTIINPPNATSTK